MSEALQVLLLVVGVLLSALVTLLISMVSGIRSDLKTVLEAQRKLNDRVLILETEAKGSKGSYQRGA